MQIIDEQIIDEPGWRDHFILTASALTSGERNKLARLASTGHLVRVSRGVYLTSGIARRRSRDVSYRDLVRSRHVTSPIPLLFSHTSAAVLWRIPRIGPWPDRVHVLSPTTTGRSTAHLVHHVGAPVDSTVTIDGVAVTPLARTVIDLARTESTTNAVVAADAALAGIRLGERTIHVDRAALVAELDRVGSGRGTRAARFAADFARAEAASPGESLSRLSIARAGLTPPVLQQRFDDDEGRMFTDFWWPEVRIAGEFDGVGKYLRDEWTDGRSAAEVVIDEKRREDRLRRQVAGLARWGWDVASSPARLGALLRAAGVR